MDDQCSGIYGVWKLVSLSGQGSKGEQIFPPDFDVQGRLIYDAGGQMMFQITKGNRPELSPEKPLSNSAEALVTAFSGYLAYFGSYTCNEAQHEIIHHIEGHSIPNWVGLNYACGFEINGDYLVTKNSLSFNDIEGELALVWERC